MKALEKEAEGKLRDYSKKHGRMPLQGGWNWEDDGTDVYDLSDLAHLMLLKQQQ